METWKTLGGELGKDFEFWHASGEPNWDELVRLLDQRKDQRAIVAVGGGSVQDLAAAASLDVQAPLDLARLFYNGEHHVPRAQRKIGFFSFPTNYSSGAFCSKSALVTKDGYKLPCFGEALCPDRIWIDPRVLSSLSEPRWQLSSIDCFTHFLEAFISISRSDSLYYQSLCGWWQDFRRSLEGKDGTLLFFLSAYLFSGFYPLQRLHWPIHVLSHSLGPSMGWGHAQTLAYLLPEFLEVYLHENSDKADWIQEFIDWFWLQDQIQARQASKAILRQAVNLACSRNARIFSQGNDRERYHQILNLT